MTNRDRGNYLKSSSRMKVLWKRAEYREIFINRMKEKNPMFFEESKRKRLEKIDYKEVLRKGRKTFGRNSGNGFPNRFELDFEDKTPLDLKMFIKFNRGDLVVEIPRTNKLRIPDFPIYDCENKLKKNDY